jgi:two-component system CheB/CheR fusion protein
MQNTAEVGRTRPLEGVRVLVVEDYADSRALFALLLKLSGAAVVAVGSGDEAVAALELDRFDALVSDIHMPGMSGLALIRKVRAWPEVGALPAVAVTADRDAKLSEEALEAGFQRHLTKPVSRDDLVDAVRTIVTADE